MLTQLSCATLHRYSAILQSWVEIIPPSRNLEQKLRNLTLYAKFNSTSTSQNACRYILFRQFIISNKCRDVRLKCLVYLGNSIKISPFYPSIFLSCPPRFAVATLVLTLLSPSKDRWILPQRIEDELYQQQHGGGGDGLQQWCCFVVVWAVLASCEIWTEKDPVPFRMAQTWVVAAQIMHPQLCHYHGIRHVRDEWLTNNTCPGDVYTRPKYTCRCGQYHVQWHECKYHICWSTSSRIYSRVACWNCGLKKPNKNGFQRT